jgi:ADP-ribosylglycohydrolase
VLHRHRFDGPGRAGFRFGQYSDDTQLARELALSLVDRRGFDAADYGRRIAAIFSEGRIVGYGRTTEAAALRIAAGVPWHEAGKQPPAAGNGSAMRVAPLGLLFAHDRAALRQAAIDQGRITHDDPRCAAGAVAIAFAVAWAAAPGRSTPSALCGELAAETAGLDPALSQALAELPAWLGAAPADVLAWLGRSGIEPSAPDGRHGISPLVTPSVLWALYAALRTPGDYWEAICTAVACGGDVDTTAAMAGAIAGAAVGLAGIPGAAVACVSDRGAGDHDALRRLAHELHALAVATAEAAGH